MQNTQVDRWLCRRCHGDEADLFFSALKHKNGVPNIENPVNGLIERWKIK